MRKIVVIVTAGLALWWASPASAQQAGQFCPKAKEGQTATATNGATVICEKRGNDTQPRWYNVAGQVETTTTQTTTAPATTAPAAAPTVQATTPAMPNTGARENREAAFGAAFVLLGIVATAWARPRFFPRVAPPIIEQERIDRAAKLLGWSDPWDEHLRR